MGFCEEQQKARLSWLTHLFARSAVSAVYRNRIVVNNINKLQNINGDKWNANKGMSQITKELSIRM
jgi:hypothetical protein